VIDPTRALLVWASREGARLWGLAAPGRQREPLDRAMPALCDLARARTPSDGCPEQPQTRRLVFWTRRGALALPCRVSRGESLGEAPETVALWPLAPPSTDALLPPASGGPSRGRRNDIETLREIARRIREGGTSAAATAPVAPMAGPDRPPAGEAPASDMDANSGLATVSAAAAAAAVPAPVPETRADTLSFMPAPANDLDTLPTADRSRALSTLSHEVRTPLAAIAGLADVMRAEVFGPLGDARYHGYAIDIAAAARHALEVVDATLARIGGDDAGKAEAGPVEAGGFASEFAIEDAITECVAIISPLAAARAVTLHEVVASRVPHVIADRRALKQVFLNLLANAVRATPPGGTVAVGARYERDDAALHVEVADTGPGMTAAEIAAVLGEAVPEERALDAIRPAPVSPGPSPPDPVASGPVGARTVNPGLGLAIARALAAANGSTIGLFPRLEGGLTARLTIPSGRLLPV
jgi:signal transduction histidine kinase